MFDDSFVASIADISSLSVIFLTSEILYLGPTNPSLAVVVVHPRNGMYGHAPLRLWNPRKGSDASSLKKEKKEY